MSEVLTSIHGRDVGLDVDRYLTARVGLKVPTILVGASGSEVAVDIAGATTLTAMTTASTGNITARGITTLSSAAKDYPIDPPEVGVRKVITTLTSSTLVRSVTRSGTSFTFQSTDGSTMVKISMASPAAAVELVGVSTALYAVINRESTDTTLSGTS